MSKIISTGSQPVGADDYALSPFACLPGKSGNAVRADGKPGGKVLVTLISRTEGATLVRENGSSEALRRGVGVLCGAGDEVFIHAIGEAIGDNPEIAYLVAGGESDTEVRTACRLCALVAACHTTPLPSS